MNYENIIFETHNNIGLIKLNRPDALNALNNALIEDLNHALSFCEQNDLYRCTIITGSEKAFAAGADIKEMQSKTFSDCLLTNFLHTWDQVTSYRKPIIAAVAGFALGGGCELAMMCDFVIAADTAKFGQPEIKLGIIPGAGGTQRLTRAIGKAKAMDLCLTGRLMDAQEAERSGLVARIVRADHLIEEAMAAAALIASQSLPSLIMAKESVLNAFETHLNEGCRAERRNFHSCFALEDQKEGMAAFLEKRPASFKDR
jgi:enoyl-CoA hydratase